MLAVLIVLLFALGWAGLADVLLRRVWEGREPTLRAGSNLLAGLAGCGWLTFFLGQVPGGFRWGLYVVAGVAVIGAILWLMRQPRWSVEAQSVIAALPLLLLALPGVLAPSTTIDWDSLAYHFAVPKIWIAEGQISFISFIHHSNFPFLIDNLYIWGLQVGGESGAKSFTLIMSLAAIIAIYGAAAEVYGKKVAIWSSLAFCSMPVVLWLSGTGYIDVGQGAFAGLSVFFLANAIRDPEKPHDLFLSSLFLGFAIASKYTGLQTAFIIGLILVFLVVRKPVALKVSPVLFLLPIVIAAPWFVRNTVNTGNPVYPFFYSALKGKNWSEYNAKIYSNEQQTFGVGREMATPQNPDYTANPLEISRLPHAILGLAYQPGRYINPNPTGGNGFGFGALGGVCLIVALMWLASGRLTRFEATILASTGVMLVAWFFLSQQSRYIIGTMFPLCILAGGAAIKIPSGKLVPVLVGVQALISFALVGKIITTMQIPAAMGQITPDEYRKNMITFAEPAVYINQELKPTRIALYDEVFGYLLDVPYFWANPGHTTEIGYEQMESVDDYMAGLEKMGISHVYVNLGLTVPEQQQALLGATGLTGEVIPIPSDMRAAMMSDVQSRWKPLLAEAVGAGKLRLVQEYGTRVIFEVVR